MTTYALFQFRRGLSDLWKSRGTTLSEGEPGIELDTGRFKIGDGIKRWSQLPYFSPSHYPDLPTTTCVGRYDNYKNSLLIGGNPEYNSQGVGSISIGGNKEKISQGNGSISIGYLSAQNQQGNSSISIGSYNTESLVNYKQPDNSIILNASGRSINENNDITGGFYVSPIRNVYGYGKPLYLTSNNEIVSGYELIGGNGVTIGINNNLQTVSLLPSKYTSIVTYPSNTSTITCNSNGFIWSHLSNTIWSKEKNGNMFNYGYTYLITGRIQLGTTNQNSELLEMWITVSNKVITSSSDFNLSNKNCLSIYKDIPRATNITTGFNFSYMFNADKSATNIGFAINQTLRHTDTSDASGAFYFIDYLNFNTLGQFI
jgi:hypothetical protein